VTIIYLNACYCILFSSRVRIGIRVSEGMTMAVILAIQYVERVQNDVQDDVMRVCRLNITDVDATTAVNTKQ